MEPPRMMFMYWKHNLISTYHVFFWCPFLITSLVICYSNLFIYTRYFEFYCELHMIPLLLLDQIEHCLIRLAIVNHKGCCFNFQDWSWDVKMKIIFFTFTTSKHDPFSHEKHSILTFCRVPHTCRRVRMWSLWCHLGPILLLGKWDV